MIRIALITIVLILPVASAQTARQQVRGEGGIITWKAHEPADCEGCEGKKTVRCRHCNGGRKKSGARCLECRGKKKSPCRQCGGKGKSFDSFVQYGCTRCSRKGFCPCGVCGGSLKLQSRSKTPPKCRSCSKKGGRPCVVCKGTRLLTFVSPSKKKLDACSMAELRALRKSLQGPLDRASAYTAESAGAPSRLFESVMGSIIKVLPAFKGELKACTRDQEKASKKQKDLGANLKAVQANMRIASVGAGIHALRAHIAVIDTLLEVHKANALRRQP